MAIAMSAVAVAQFTPGQDSPVATGRSPVSIATGDFNGDGVPDLAVVNSSDNSVTVLLGNGSGGFIAAGNPIAVGAGAAAIAAWGYVACNPQCVVQDGVAVANSMDNTVSVLQSNANGSAFTAVTGSPLAVGLRPVYVAVADVNNDGVPDLAVANSGDHTVTVLLGLAKGGFAPATGSPFAAGSKPVFIAVADLNGDYLPDLAIVNAGDDTLTVLLGDGKGGFAPASGTPYAVGRTPLSVAAADFNKDGTADLAIANSGDNTVTVLLGTGMGGFTAALNSPFAVGKAPSAIAAADFNRDNSFDLAVANSGDNTVAVLLGDGAGGFAAAPYSPLVVGSNPEFGAIADFNGDGKPDMAIANSGSNNLTVLLNGYLAGIPAPRVLSAASAAATVSSGEIVAIYGADFANTAASATTVPLPKELGGVSAVFKVVDIIGEPVYSGAMPMFYVSPTQINAQIPAGASFPPCNQGSGSVYSTSIEIATPFGGQTAPVNATPVPAPALFTANENGTGPVIAQFVTNLPDGTQQIIDTAECPAGVGTCIPVPLDVTAGPSALVLYGTGISEYSTFPNGLTVTAGNQPLQVFYAGPSPQYVALDQINVWMPASLAGLGTVNLTVGVSGTTPGLGANCSFAVTSNIVTIDIQ